MIWWLSLMVITLVAIGTRFYGISEPDVVVWDEKHFGSMINWYLNGSFFFDVHPPLGKLLLSGVAYLSGYDGSEYFTNPGDVYNQTSYIYIRMYSASCGCLTCISVFLTVWYLTCSLMASLTATSLILFDGAMISLSRYILLDPSLLTFQMTSIAAFAKWKSSSSIFSLFLAGIFMALAVSIKFTTVFTVLLFGVTMLKYFWNLLSNLNLKMSFIIYRFISYGFLMAVIPLFIYLSIFCIHLKLLYKSGPGDVLYSPLFQSALEGNHLYNANISQFIKDGSVVSLKNLQTGASYLHSHHLQYPDYLGTQKQQVTGYSHKSNLNLWVLIHVKNDSNERNEVNIESGSKVMLQHKHTKTFLSVQELEAPLTKSQYLVTATPLQEENAEWILESRNFFDSVGSIQTLVTKFRLINKMLNCALMIINVKSLPSWGLNQHEVTCTRKTKQNSVSWVFEENYNLEEPQMNTKDLKFGILSKLIESHQVMLIANQLLKAKEGEITSQPWNWPFNTEGQWLSVVHRKVYMFGNDVVWKLNLYVLLIFPLLYLVIDGIERRRKLKTNDNIIDCCLWLYFGWILHYLPFFIINRVLIIIIWLHSFLILSLQVCVVIDWFSSKIPKLMQPCLFVIVLSAVLHGFWSQFNYIYGIPVEDNDIEI